MNSLHLNINVNLQQLIAVIKQLSPKEKLKLNDVIWGEEMEIPAEQQKLVLERIKKSKKNPNKLLNWEEASKKLNS